jgi:hypothetical protein
MCTLENQRDQISALSLSLRFQRHLIATSYVWWLMTALTTEDWHCSNKFLMPARKVELWTHLLEREQLGHYTWKMAPCWVLVVATSKSPHMGDLTGLGNVVPSTTFTVQLHQPNITRKIRYTRKSLMRILSGNHEICAWHYTTAAFLSESDL